MQSCRGDGVIVFGPINVGKSAGTCRQACRVNAQHYAESAVLFTNF